MTEPREGLPPELRVVEAALLRGSVPGVPPGLRGKVLASVRCELTAASVSERRNGGSFWSYWGLLAASFVLAANFAIAVASDTRIQVAPTLPAVSSQDMAQARDLLPDCSEAELWACLMQVRSASLTPAVPVVRGSVNAAAASL